MNVGRLGDTSGTFQQQLGLEVELKREVRAGDTDVSIRAKV